MLLSIWLLSAILVQTPGAVQPGLEPRSPLAGVWLVQELDGIAVMPHTRVTIEFQESRVRGFASCNSYSASFSVSGTKVQVSELLTTMMACDGAVMSQERDFKELLPSVVRYELRSDDTVVLTTDRGRTIRARRQATSGL